MSSEGSVLQRTRGRDSLWWVTTSVGALVVLLLVYLVILIPTGTNLIPWSATDETPSANGGPVADLQVAISKELTAYYGFDYTTIGSAIATVSQGSTGKFRALIDARAETLKSGAELWKTNATAEVTQIAVHQMKGNNATALVVVNQTMKNTQTAKLQRVGTCAAGTQCSVFHLWVTYQLVAGQWKLSDLGYWQ